MAVGYQLRGEVALVTLDRPDVYNSVDQTMAEELTAALARAGAEARALVVTGAGRAFCAGADLADLAADYDSGNPNLAGVIRDRFNPVIHALVEVPLPTVAAVNGVAAGAGIGLAMACDLRLGSAQASFISAFINVALIPDSGSTWFLTHSIGVSRAMEMAMTGRRVEADEAAACGLLHRLVQDDVVEAALEAGGHPCRWANRGLPRHSPGAPFGQFGDTRRSAGRRGAGPGRARLAPGTSRGRGRLSGQAPS